MKWMTKGFIALGTLAIVGAQDTSAQRVETIMRAADRLELSRDQLERLDDLRREAVEHRTGDAREMRELRSQLEAGQIRRSDLLAAREDRVDALREFREEQRAAVAEILTEEQLASLDEAVRRDLRAGRGPEDSRRLRFDRGDRGPRGQDGPSFRRGRPGGDRAGPAFRGGPDTPRRLGDAPGARPGPAAFGAFE